MHIIQHTTRSPRGLAGRPRSSSRTRTGGRKVTRALLVAILESQPFASFLPDSSCSAVSEQYRCVNLTLWLRWASQFICIPPCHALTAALFALVFVETNPLAPGLRGVGTGYYAFFLLLLKVRCWGLISRRGELGLSHPRSTTTLRRPPSRWCACTPFAGAAYRTDPDHPGVLGAQSRHHYYQRPSGPLLDVLRAVVGVPGSSSACSPAVCCSFCAFRPVPG
jgi:hypothetical protein